MKMHQMAAAAVKTLFLCVLVTAGPGIYAGPTIFPAGGESACEADWMTRQPFDSLPSLFILQSIERDAERGVLAAQLRLGMVYKTLDGKWKTPDDYSYNIKRLEKAIKTGSKSAAAHLAIIQYILLKPRSIDHRTYIKTLIPAALEERNPWVATTLMDLTRRRWGREGDSDSKGCLRFEKPEECNGGDLLPKPDTRKWAEIAGEGGNPVAQAWLCEAATDGQPDHGQPIDPKTAFKWCLIASHNACEYWSPGKLYPRYFGGSGADKNQPEALRWLEIKKQPWRQDGHRYFFIPQK